MIAGFIFGIKIFTENNSRYLFRYLNITENNSRYLYLYLNITDFFFLRYLTFTGASGMPLFKPSIRWKKNTGNTGQPVHRYSLPSG